MANDKGSSSDVNGSTSETTEEDDRIHLGGVLLGSRFEKVYEICAVMDLRPGDFFAMAIEKVLAEHGWTVDPSEDAKIEAQLKTERKAYAKKLAAKKAAKAA